MNINQNWLDSLKSLGLALDQSDHFREKLQKLYQSRGRHYHNFFHIEALLTAMHAQQAELNQPAVVALAIWYHDAIYTSLRKDNEARSASLAGKDLLALGAGRDLIARVSFLILQTANHTQAKSPEDHDLGWFLDFDLEILGAEPRQYQTYSEQIRKEYRLIPELLYRKGRIKVLKQMLEAPFLYHSPLYRKRYERQARQNILQELSQWQVDDLDLF